MKRTWSIFFLLSILEGCAALAALVLIPGEGLSFARLALIGTVLIPLVILGWLLFRSIDADWRVRFLEPTTHLKILNFLVIFSSLLFVILSLVLFLLRYLHPEVTASYYIRARPVLTYLLLLTVQTSLWMTILRKGLHPQSLKTRRGVLLPAMVGFGVFVLLWLIVVITGLGITKDTSYWAEPGVPILGWQLALALLIGFGFFLYILRFSRFQRLYLLIPVVIWLLAVGIWMSAPLSTLRNSFYAPIRPPYNQPFPASDASYYDLDAQSLLMGNGFIHPIPSRPFFILFLAGLHALLGQDYARLVLGQTLVFALLPVALYLLGTKMHSRTAGLMIALLAIFREWTSLWVASEARVSNTKMLLSEFITTLVLIAYLLLLMRWFRERRGGSLLAFASGGALGLQLLLRTQTGFLAAGVILIALFVFWPDWKKWIAHSILFAMGLLLAISPWLLRNYVLTGEASLDDPIQIKAVASMYSGGTPTSNFPLFEGQTPEEISQYVVSVILEKPGYVAGFVANQFLANSIDTLLVLPIFARYDGLSAPIYPYWGEWDTYLSPVNILLFIVYLAVIALGIAAAWKRLGWVGLLPLVFFIFYALATSLARYSGWRYIFPADWVGYFYFALGTVELFSMLVVLFGADPNATFPELVSQIDSPPNHRWKFAALAGIFLLIGGLPWMIESAIHRQDPICTGSISACLAVQGVKDEQAGAFLDQPGAVSLTGRVLYPRYFPRFDGLSSTNPAPAFAPRDFPRMGFLMLTSGGVEQVVLPMKGSRPFPNAQDAILIGCQRDGYVEVKLILFPAAGEIFSNGSLSDSCSTP